MENKIIEVMKDINQYIINSQDFNRDKLLLLNDKFNLNIDPLTTDSAVLQKINKKLFNIKEGLKEDEKKSKSLKRNMGTLSQEEAEELFSQFENYIFDMIKTPDYRSHSKKKKVFLGYLENLWGHGSIDNGRWEGNNEDLFQQGRLYLWDILQKYGKRPENRKNFQNRDRVGDKDTLSSVSTFVYGSVYRLFINLSKSSVTSSRTGREIEEVSGKDQNINNYYKPTHIEYDPTVVESYYKSNQLPDLEFSKEEYSNHEWKKICKELQVPKDSKLVKILKGRILHSKENYGIVQR